MSRHKLRRGEVIDINVKGVIATKAPDGQNRVRMLLADGRHWYDGRDDTSCYSRGNRTPSIHKPGNKASQAVATLLSMHVDVVKIQCCKQFGVFVNIDLKHPRLIEVLDELARVLLIVADAYECRS